MKKRILVGIGIVLAVVAAALGGVYYMLDREVSKTADNEMLDNIYIDDKDVSGMKVDEVKKFFEEKLSSYQTEKVVLKLEEEQVEFTLADFGLYAINLEDVLDEALSYGKGGSLWERYQAAKELKEKAKKFDIAYSVDSEVVKATVSEKTKNMGEKPKNAVITRKDGKFVIEREIAGTQVDVEASTKIIMERFDDEWEAKGPEKFELVSMVKDAKITEEELLKIQDKLGSYTTEFESGNDRAKNIALATSRINGTVLMPGEEMSASDGMGERSEKNGYRPAGTYLNGEVVDGVGGGVCQVSTTLYNSVLNAELEVTERSPHSMIVSYVPAAQDAAISAGYKDLKFKNNTEAPVYIEGYTKGGSVTFVIYGLETRSESRTVKYVSETLSTTPRTDKFVEASGSAFGIKKSASGHTGKKAVLWKVVYENGKEISREKVNTSNYIMSPNTYKVGTSSSNAEASAIVKKAISSQNRSKIQAAINRANALIESSKAPEVQETTPAQ